MEIEIDVGEQTMDWENNCGFVCRWI